MITNILTEYSGLRGISRNESVFAVYATHQLEDGRINTGPDYISMSGDNARQEIVDWLLEDTKVVDYHIKPVSHREYENIRLGNAAEKMARILSSYHKIGYPEEIE